MRKMNTIALLTAIAIGGSAHAFVITQYQATLEGVQEVPPNASTGTGSVTLNFDSDTNTLSITSGSYSGLFANSTASHIHIAPAGANGPVIITLTHSASTSGNLSGSGVLTAPQLDALVTEGLYVNVHTSSFPGGEIRGQIAAVPVVKPPAMTVIYSEIPSSPTGNAPGMVDLAGNPIVAPFGALFDLNVSWDGSQWAVRADTTVTDTFDQVVILGSGTVGDAYLQDGQAVPGGAPGELWDFFDPRPLTWDENGNIGFSARAKGGVSAVKEKIVKVIKNTPTIAYTESSPTTNLIDVAANPTGDELIGNSVGSVQLLNDGQIFFANTPIQNCHSSRYPAVFKDNAGFAQSGVTAIGFEVWDSFGFDDCGMTPDGKHWFATGDTENPVTTLDRIFAVNNVKIVQENTLIGETGITAADIFFARIIPNGTWFARGDDTADNDWALKGNGEEYSLIAKTGDPITTGSTELWGNTISGFNGNTGGDWLITGNTNNPDPLIDTVMVLNGTEVILREGDPVDVNGNGKFDDDAFIGNTNVGTLISGFQPDDLFITNDQVIYTLVVLRNAANVNIGDAFLRIELDPVTPCVADIAPPGGNGTVDVDDLILVINSWGECAKGEECLADITGNNVVDVDDLLEVINGWGDCL